MQDKKQPKTINAHELIVAQLDTKARVPYRVYEHIASELNSEFMRNSSVFNYDDFDATKLNIKIIQAPEFLATYFDWLGKTPNKIEAFNDLILNNTLETLDSFINSYYKHLKTTSSYFLLFFADWYNKAIDELDGESIRPYQKIVIASLPN